VTPKRVGFITPQFVTELATGGGLGNYLARTTRALLEAGHWPEVFVTSREAPGRILWEGIPVHRVRRLDQRRAGRAALRILRGAGLRRLQPVLVMLGDAWALAAALRRREAEAPFDLVQSADYLGAGFFVPRRAGRPHLVRCTSASELTGAADGDRSARRAWAGRLQRACIRRADAAYAPSRFVAEHFATRHGLQLEVVRPPVFRDAEPSLEPIPGLPKRYLIHFGKLADVKGTSVLARALPLAWREEPELSLVLAGRDRDGRLPEWQAGWGRQRERVVWLGELEKPELYTALRGAEAAVLPSLADNLPNTAIESLLFGVPVIGTDGASLDELVEPGVSGELVPAGDSAALAAAMLRAWRGQGVARGFRWDSEVADAMRPERAVQSLLRLAGLDGA
jgi:glycosyltransferase involved in cell wall biosynthesis